MTAVNLASADFISGECLAALYAALFVFVLVVRGGAFHIRTRSLKLFCGAEVVLSITRAIYVAM
jgi:hypothetical protein